MSDYLSRHPAANDTTRRRYANLPVWAQAELDRLSAELDGLEHRTATSHEDSDTWAHPYAKVPTPIGRPKVIRHQYPEGMEVTLTWRADQRPLTVPRLEIMVTGGNPVIEMGGACNVAILRLEVDR